MELSRRVVVALLCRPRHQHCWLLPAAACAGAHPPPHHHDAAADSATPQDVQPCHPPQGQDRRCAGALPERSPPRLLNPVGLRGFASQGAAASADKKPLPPEQRSRSDGGVDPALFGGLSTAGPRARFYKAVSVAEAKEGSGQFHVLLDHRPVRTPGRKVLAVPSRALALALAAEWEWQATSKPQMHSMPLMSLAATALDQPKPRDKVIESLLKFVHADATCCRLEPGSKVERRQAQLHDPLLRWAAGELGWRMVPSGALLSPPQDEQTVEAVRGFLERLDSFQLAAMEQLTSTSKSVVVAAAVLLGRLTPQEAIKATRVEEDCQVEDWGPVEAGHDLDEADVVTRITGPSVFLRLLSLRH